MDALKELLHNLNSQIPLSETLDRYDLTIKQMGIDPGCPIALRAFEHILAQYQSSSKQRPRSSRKPFPTINDPENMWAFSFAKERPIMEVQSFGKQQKAQQGHPVVPVQLNFDAPHVQKEEIKAKQHLIKLMLTRAAFGLIKKNHIRVPSETEQVQPLTQKVTEWMHLKAEVMVEDYFIALRDRARMTTEERNRENQIELNESKTMKMLALFRIRTNHNLFLSTPSLHLKLKHLNLLRMRRHHKHRLQCNAALAESCGAFGKIAKQIESVLLLKLLRRRVGMNNSREQQKVKQITYLIKGKTLLSSLRTESEFSIVYWGKPGGIPKHSLVFLSMLFSALKATLRRQGYNFQWMAQLQPALQAIDSRTGHSLRKHNLSRLFNALHSHVQTQRQQQSQLNCILAQRVINALCLNSIINHQNSKTLQNSLNISTTLGLKFKSESLRLLSIPHKSRFVQTKIRLNRARECLNSLLNFKIASQHHRGRLISFLSRWRLIHLGIVFDEAKRILLTSVINNKLVASFRSHKNSQLLKNILTAFKSFILQEKILQKRTRNLIRLRLGRHYHHFTLAVLNKPFNRPPTAIDTLKSIRRERALLQMFNGYKTARLKKMVYQQVKIEYSLRLQWKVLQVLSAVTEQGMYERELSVIIEKRVLKRRKRESIVSWVDRLVMVLICRKIARMHTRNVLEWAFLQLRK